jgi:CubicO group peptidase (beta-lactamase class C family)
MKRILAGLYLATISATAFSAPEEFSMGKLWGYPACNNHFVDQGCRVGAFSTIPPHTGSAVNPNSTREVRKSNNISELPRYAEDFDTAFIDEYFASQKALGLLILKNGKVVYENYQYGRKSNMVFRGFSMSKTVVGMLTGIALDKGHIKSLDDTADTYFQELSGTAYGATTIKNLLTMRSGIEYKEKADSSAIPDRRRYWWSMNNSYYKGPDAIIEIARYFNKRSYEQGTRFNYSTLETDILARVLVKATGMTLSEMTEKWIWKDIGAEFSAYWMVFDSDSLEHGGGGLYASLRDWGRFALMLSNKGRVKDKQIISEKYIEDATSLIRQNRELLPNKLHYGYQTWIFPGPHSRRLFALYGSFGQSILIQPSSGVIIVQLSAYDTEERDPRYSLPKAQFSEKLFKMLGSR